MGTGEAKSVGRGRGEQFWPLGTLRSEAWTWLGLAAFFAWIQLLLCFEGVLRDQVEMRGGLVHDPLFLTATLTAGVALILEGVLTKLPRGVTGRVSRSTLVFLALGSGSSCGACLLTALFPSVPMAASIALGAAAGLWMAWGTVAWGETLARLDLRVALIMLFAAACLQWVPLVLLDLLNLPARAVLVATLPIASVVALLRTERASLEDSQTGPCQSAGLTWDTQSRTSSPSPREFRRGSALSHSSLARLAAAMLIFSLVVEFVQTFFIKLLPGRLDPSLFKWVFFLVVAAVLSITVFCLLLMGLQSRYRPEYFWRTMFVLCVGGVCASATMASGVSADTRLFSAYLMIYVGFSLITPTGWLLGLAFVMLRRTPARVAFGFAAGCQYIGLFLGFLLVETIVRSNPEIEGAPMASFAVLAAALALAVAYAMVFPERELLSLAPALFGLSSESLSQRCATVAERFGLTARETEVCALLARGRDAAFVASQLGISRATVGVHRRNVYAKLGVHSQQELLSLIELFDEQ